VSPATVENVLVDPGPDTVDRRPVHGAVTASGRAAAGPADPVVTPGSGPLPRLGAAATLPLLLVLGLVALTPSSAIAQGDDDSTALALLRRAVAAATSVSYRGVQADATWTSSGITTRTIDVRQAESLRTMTVRASAGTAMTMTTPPVRAAAGMVDPLALIAAAYAVSYAGKDVVVGRTASVVVALRGGRVAARLWLDDDCGLLLRQEIWDLHGRLTRMTGFVALEEPLVGRVGAASTGTGVDLLGSPIGSPTAESGAAAGGLIGEPGTFGGGPGEGVAGVQSTASRLHSPCPDLLPGGFRLVDAREVAVPGATGPASRALQLTYSDGLSAMSVFVQNGRLPGSGLSGIIPQEWGGARVYLAPGWPVRAVWQGEGHVFTVVSDAPVDEVVAAARALPGVRGSTGLFRRVASLVHTVEVLLPGR
jgi:sigma-E factor negative regulatory protein RseB